MLDGELRPMQSMSVCLMEVKYHHSQSNQVPGNYFLQSHKNQGAATHGSHTGLSVTLIQLPLSKQEEVVGLSTSPSIINNSAVFKGVGFFCKYSL